jgi:hypothetical protein
MISFISKSSCTARGFAALESAAEEEIANERANANWWRSRASMWFRRAAKSEGKTQ